jgi:PAS domain S-box-containing protein
MKSTNQDSHYTKGLIEAMLDPMVAIDLTGKIVEANEALVKITGVSRAGLMGTKFSVHFTDQNKAEEGFKHVVETGAVSDLRLTIKHKNGSLTEVVYNASAYKDSEDNIVGFFAAARDVTGQKWSGDLQIANKELAFQNDEKEKRAAELILANKELAFQNDEKEKRAAELILANKELAFQNDEKEKRAAELILANKELAFQNNEKEKRAAELILANEELEFQNDEKEKRAAELRIANYARGLIEASRDPLFTISPNGKITDLNSASSFVTGISREELIGSNFFNYFTEPDKAKEGYEEIFKKGFVADYPLTIIDGELTDVLFNGSVYKDDRGNVLGAVVVARVITEQKRIEKELIEARVFAELATEIAEVAQAKAESATRIAEDAVKAKQQFLSNMSHEIRTPMNAIIGFTKVVLKTEITAKQKEYLTAIKISGDALIVLINDILDLAKVDAGKMTFEHSPFKMASSISAMLHLFETKIQEKNLELIKEYDERIPEVLIGDPVRLHQIILNLVSNAVKFTSKGKITVKVKMLSQTVDDVQIEFAVSDTGIGIAESKLSKIFENFQQASSGTSRLFGGTGLGLAIVKQLVEPQGGSINVTSKINEGSTFSFILTFQKTTAEAESESEMVELDLEIEKVRVLVVEDIALNQLLMKTLLDDFGFERDIAANGKIAIDKLKTNEYDIILMDLQMPEMNGFEATEYIRNTMKLSIPIIALTADVTTADLEKCTKVGMNDYLAKPVDDRALYRKIVQHIKKSTGAAPIIRKVDNAGLVSYVDLKYLNTRTKSNPVLMIEMISLYLEQTPLLILTMKQSLQDGNWSALHSAVHKMIPSFSIMGMSNDFVQLAQKIQVYAQAQEQAGNINDMVDKLEKVCSQSCNELTQELKRLKNEPQ